MEILTGNNILAGLDSYFKDNGYDNLYIITDHNVKYYHGKYLSSLLKGYNYKFYSIPPGEKSKSIDVVLSIYDDLIENQIDRESLIIAFGGGVVGDITGFVAATFKRGIDYIQIPTTLLAQVDSSIGGKVGIDYKGLKNIIGSFHFPKLILIDIQLLKTLSNRDITTGLAEILKYGLIADYDLFNYISSNLSKAYNKDEHFLLDLVNKSISIKQDIVSRDKFDKGERRILNFGHTVGHSIESYFDFSQYNHGEAVILGMIYESYIGKEVGLIDDDYFWEIYNSLTKLITPLKFNDLEIKYLLEIMENDKKKLNDQTILILPIGKGKVGIFNDVDVDLIINSLKGEWF